MISEVERWTPRGWPPWGRPRPRPSRTTAKAGLPARTRDRRARRHGQLPIPGARRRSRWTRLTRSEVRSQRGEDDSSSPRCDSPSAPERFGGGRKLGRMPSSSPTSVLSGGHNRARMIHPAPVVTSVGQGARAFGKASLAVAGRDCCLPWTVENRGRLLFDPSDYLRAVHAARGQVGMAGDLRPAGAVFPGMTAPPPTPVRGRPTRSPQRKRCLPPPRAPSAERRPSAEIGRAHV